MNAKYRAKHSSRLAGALVLSAWLMPLQVTADDGNLTQQLRTQQHKSRFQLMLGQVAESARQRAAAGHRATRKRGGSPSARTLGDWTQSPGLAPITVTEPPRLRIDADDRLRSGARQAYERDQRQILDHRQKRSALIAGARSGGAARVNGFQQKRRALVRFKTQNQRLTLQRKLRR
jgi:hypothetical protein